MSHVTKFYIRTAIAATALVLIVFALLSSEPYANNGFRFSEILTTLTGYVVSGVVLGIVYGAWRVMLKSAQARDEAQSTTPGRKRSI